MRRLLLGCWSLIYRASQVLGAVFYPHPDFLAALRSGPACPGHPERLVPLQPPTSTERALWAQLDDS
ncbi:MAG: DUF6059 family protein [Kibdelosporangium sp.]